MKTSRREFLRISTAAGSAFVLSVQVPNLLAESGAAEFAPNAYIRIGSDDSIRLWVTRSEMGQGVRTALPMMLADELDVDWTKIIVEQAAAAPRFKGIRLRTSGSGSAVGTWKSLRMAGAAAREMLTTAAAKQWNVDVAECKASGGAVMQAATGRKLTYGQLAARAATLPVPAAPVPKSKEQYRYLGRPMKRLDGAAIVTGRAVYGADVRPPGMLHAVMVRCPYMGGKLTSFDATDAMRIPGVRHVVPIKSGIATGVAVAADNTWSAMKGSQALKVEWDPGPNKNFESEAFMRSMYAALDAPATDGYFVRDDGDAESALKASARRISAEYEYPFQAHAPVETLNCTADVRANSCEIWAPTQTPDTAQAEVAKTLGMPLDSVRINVTLLGGAFGRRLFSDFIYEAVELSKTIGKPVQMLWTREDDMRHGYFQPPSVDRIIAGFDANGALVAWKHRSVGSDLSMFGLPTEESKKNRRRYADDGSPWGTFDNPYAITNLFADYVPVNSCVPTGPWRAVEYPGRVFARECFVDEIAHAAGRDPVELRLALLPSRSLQLGPSQISLERLARVVKLAAEKSNWGKPFSQSDRLFGRGIACNVYDTDCFVAQVAEVSVSRAFDDIRVHRVVCAVDCGFPINPAGIEGQAESGITWGLSAALHGKTDFKDGGAVQRTYRDFRVVRMNEAPVVETHIVAGAETPGGFGETAVPPAAPAVANAVFAATGKRIRSLPITAEKLKS
jgi:isoquinoline 1-oxidoreductase subunit beta